MTTIVILAVILICIVSVYRGLKTEAWTEKPSGLAAIKAGYAAELRGPGTYELEVAGTFYYQGELTRICGRQKSGNYEKEVRATLVHEDENAHDDKAIRIDVDGLTVGHLPKENTLDYRKKMRDAGYPGVNATCSAMIKSWRPARGAESVRYFVYLDLPVEDSGDVRPTPRRRRIHVVPG